jgi:hypothetical protein
LLAFVLHARASHVRLRSTVLKLVCTHCTCCRESGVKCTVVSQAIRHTNVMLLYGSRGFPPLPEDEDSAPTGSTRSAGEHRTRRGGPCCRREEDRRAIHRCIGVAALRARRHSNERDAKRQACCNEATGRWDCRDARQRTTMYTYIYLYTFFFFVAKC